MAWRNGLGTTVEILKRDLPYSDGFAWRLSMASVAENGQFSNFAGYDRTLVLLSGGGISLQHDGSRQHVLEKPLQLARFSGDSSTTAVLHDGPIEDFNIMTRRGLYRTETTCSIDCNHRSLATTADILFIYAASGDIVASIESNESVIVPSNSLLLLEPAPLGDITIAGVAFIAVELYEDEN